MPAFELGVCSSIRGVYAQYQEKLKKKLNKSRAIVEDPEILMSF